ncbi:hypothetical protein ACTXJH_06590 [Psychrobacter celer]|uniref:hypothetical protein n=1 Tax=Psychrobacter celer TaxID=306572 RepID=UPI003FD23EA6
MGFVKKIYDSISGKRGAKAAKEAGQMQADSSRYAADIAQKQFEQTRQDQMPWLNAGKGALGQLQNHIGQSRDYEDPYADAINKRLAGLGGGNVGASRFNDTTRKQIQANYDSGKYTGGLSLDEFEADPGYNFRKSQGMDGIESSAAAGGGLLSGAALKSLNRYNSDLASQEYGNAWSRDQAQKQQQFGVDTGLRGQDHSIFADNANRSLQAQIANQNYGLNALNTLMGARSQDYQLFSNEDSRKYNQYANLAGVGQQTANNLGAFGAQNAMNQGNALIAGANAQANGIVGAANSRRQGFNNILNLGMKAGDMFF